MSAQCPVCNQKLGSHHTAACHHWGQVLPSECPGAIEAAIAVVKSREAEQRDVPHALQRAVKAEQRVAELEAALLNACREKFLHGHTTTLLTDSLRLKVPGVEHYESWGEERKSKLQQTETLLRELWDTTPRDLRGSEVGERVRTFLEQEKK